MKDEILSIIDKYLLLFPEEKNRQGQFLKFVNDYDDSEITDWNNFNGHIVASGFVYFKEYKKFLVLYHKDLKMYVYPGGHVDSTDKNVLLAAKRETTEETGLSNFDVCSLSSDEMVPIDIDTQLVEYNERLNLPAHYHYDFRYLFVVDKMTDINMDTDEMSDYKFITIDELKNDSNYKEVFKKIEECLLKIRQEV